MKKNISIHLLFLLSGILHLAILMLSWNLTREKASSFSLASGITGLSFCLNSIVYLSLLGFLRITPKGKNEVNTGETLIKAVPEKTLIPREFIDPKLSAEKLFKNVMLKTSILSFGRKLLGNISDDFEIMQGIFYVLNREKTLFEPAASYAMVNTPHIKSFAPGEGITGEAARKKEITLVKNLPDEYRMIISGLGSKSPSYLYLVPLFIENNCLGIIEISTFRELQENRLSILNYCIDLGGKKLHQFLEKLNEK